MRACDLYRQHQIEWQSSAFEPSEAECCGFRHIGQRDAMATLEQCNRRRQTDERAAPVTSGTLSFVIGRLTIHKEQELQNGRIRLRGRFQLRPMTHARKDDFIHQSGQPPPGVFCGRTVQLLQPVQLAGEEE